MDGVFPDTFITERCYLAESLWRCVAKIVSDCKETETIEMSWICSGKLGGLPVRERDILTSMDVEIERVCVRMFLGMETSVFCAVFCPRILWSSQAVFTALPDYFSNRQTAEPIVHLLITVDIFWFNNLTFCWNGEFTWKPVYPLTTGFYGISGI